MPPPRNRWHPDTRSSHPWKDGALGALIGVCFGVYAVLLVLYLPTVAVMSAEYVSRDTVTNPHPYDHMPSWWYVCLILTLIGGGAVIGAAHRISGHP